MSKKKSKSAPLGPGIKSKKIKKRKAGGSSKPKPTATVTSSSSRPAEADPAVYGVVASEYNIQAQINWLTAPPSSQDKKNAGTLPALPSKKPVRGYHRDLCEACEEGECLMYCDSCPTAYHAICDDPPLPPEDYEAVGVNWKCKRCRTFGANEEAENQGKEARKKQCDTIDPAKRPVAAFFSEALAHAKAQNPVQFKLPKDLPAYEYPFPGASRHGLKKCRQRTNVIDVENGMVPKPRVVCYQCARTCRVGPLIQCDKCDTFFHLDCVDPPLTTIPTTIWLCPLHPEPMQESKLLTSVALSQRLKIWEDNEKPVKRHAIMINFLRKTSRKNPMFRRKQPIKMLQACKVPQIVRNCYSVQRAYAREDFGALQTLAAACEGERDKIMVEQSFRKYREGLWKKYTPIDRILCGQLRQIELLRRQNDQNLLNLKVQLRRQELIGTGIVPNDAQIILEIKQQMAYSLTPQSTPVVSNTSGSSATTSADIKPEAGTVSQEGNCPPIPNASILDVTDEYGHEWIRLEKEMRSEYADLLARSIKRELCKNVQPNLPSNTTNSNDTGPHGKGQTLVNPCYVKDNAALTNQPRSSANLTGFSSHSKSSDPSRNPLKYPLPTVKEVKTIPKKDIYKLAALQIRNLKLKQDERNSRVFSYRQIVKDQILDYNPPIIQFYVESHHATTELTGRCFWLGSDSTCDWNLKELIPCNRLDKQHAKIFYNKLERCWEILNYSANGISVNHTWFGINTRPTTAGVPERLLELQEMSNKRVDDYIKANASVLKPHDHDVCKCPPFPSTYMLDVHEGSSRLEPGYRVQIGCVKLIVQHFNYV